MEWKKEFKLPVRDALYIAALVLFIVSLYLGSLLLFFFAVIFSLVNVISNYYLKHVAQDLKLVNNRQSVRLFAGDEDALSIPIENDGRLPVFFGTCAFTLDKLVEVRNVDLDHSERTQNHYIFPVTVSGHSIQQRQVQVKGLRRGVAKFSDIHVTVRDWFGLGKVDLVYDTFFHTEVIVYPELIPVYGLDQIKTRWQGSQPFEYSLDEDLSSPTGTRDYLRSDSFNRIHWKATAKTGELQTKVFQKTTGMTWVLLFNLSREGGSGNDLEREISSTAYICKYAAERNIPFELYVNIKIRGKGEIMHLYADEGRKQLARALELLARVNVYSVTVPVEWMLSYVDRQQYQNPIMILCNVSDADDKQKTLQTWKNKNFGLFRIEHREESTYVANLSKRKAVS